MSGFINLFSLLFVCAGLIVIADSNTDVTLKRESNKWISRLHNTSGAGIQLVDNKILLNNFTYDGLSPDAHFYVGITDTPSNNNGILINFESDSGGRLRPFNSENVSLDIPENVNPEEIKWLAVRCEIDDETIGSISFNQENSKKHQYNNIGKTKFVQLEPFSSDSHGFRSGPILLVNEGTFLVTNFFYNGKAPDAHFWIGNLTKGEDNFGILLLDEYQTNNTLTDYTGKDFYITLPEDYKARDSKYFGVWSQIAKRNVGFTTIPEDIPELFEADGRHEFDDEDRYIARLPKCCAEDQAKTVKGCQNKDGGKEIPVNIHEGNLTTFNDEPLSSVSYVRYAHTLSCEHNMYHLDPNKDTFYLLTSGFLLLETNVITKDNFCIDFYNSKDETKHDEENGVSKENDVWMETVFMCFTESHLPEFVQDIYVACIYISAVFLFLTTLIFIKVKNARNARGFNVLGYSFFMSVSFALLATVKLLRVQEETCVKFSYFYQFFIVSSFMWLFFLTFETYHQTTHFKIKHRKGRFYCYAGFALGIPCLAVLISVLIKDSIPTFTNKYSTPDPCWFRSDRKVAFYYVPIMLSIVLNIVFCILTWIKIRQNDAEDHYLWRMLRSNIKNVFRSCYLQLSVMALCWTVEILSYYFETVHGFWIAIEIINSLQGLFVFIIFILHDPVIEILQNLYKARRKGKYDHTEDLYIRGDTARPPSMHLKTLGSIEHAESVEDLCAHNSYNEYK